MPDEAELQQWLDSLTVAYIAADEQQLTHRASWRPKTSRKPRQVSRRRQFVRPVAAHHART